MVQHDKSENSKNSGPPLPPNQKVKVTQVYPDRYTLTPSLIDTHPHTQAQHYIQSTHMSHISGRMQVAMLGL